MDGADEIDIVISVGKFLVGDYESVCDEIQELKETCKDKHLKVILDRRPPYGLEHQAGLHPGDVCRS